MSKTKAGGTTKNNRDSAGRRLGVKVFAGQPVKTGMIIVRQRGRSKTAGPGTKMSKDYSIHADRDGVVEYRKTRVRRFTGRTVPRTEVRVV